MEGMLWGRGETGNAALGESQARLEAGFRKPHIDKGFNRISFPSVNMP